MTPDPVTIVEDTPLSEIVQLMERRRIKRVPVMRGKKLIGIVSRANLVHALASLAREARPSAAADWAIREQILLELKKQSWAPIASVSVIVRDGVVELWGTIFDDRERNALVVAAENVPGVKEVRDHLAWIDPNSGLLIYQPESNAGRARAS
jgi:CBS domain-containing protein